jgi:thymidylate synthase (FAD)
MKVELLYHTPLWVCARAIRTCWDSHDKSDSEPQYDVVDGSYLGTITGTKDKALIERVGNKNKHSSTLEHLVYTFEIDGISRACLQELVRHRIASLSVKSTRYALKKLRDEECNVDDFLVTTGNEIIDRSAWATLNQVQQLLRLGISNDVVKYMLPEVFKTSLVWTINARSLQNFLYLRLSDNALWEIRKLAKEVYMQLPDEHKYLFPVPPKDIE